MLYLEINTIIIFTIEIIYFPLSSVEMKSKIITWKLKQINLCGFGVSVYITNNNNNN